MTSDPFSRFAAQSDRGSIEYEEFERTVAADDCVVVDVREAREFAASHIAKSINMPLSTFSPERLPAGKPIVLICQSGSRSRSALSQAQTIGLKDVKHYAGGVAGGLRAGAR
jgi:rhodanese-related sulfurtransferase